jgi:DNA-directed RNA polymerase specialized sigma24 family protein
MAPSAPAELPESVLSAREITEGILSLSAADQYRFKRASEYLSYGGARAAQDLRHEAVRRAIAGSRKCPRRLPVVVFLIGAMRSIAHADRKAARREPRAAPKNANLNCHSILDAADPRIGPEEQILRREDIAEMKNRVLALFEDDISAQTLVEGQFDGMEGKELKKLVGLNDKEYATKRRFIRRTIDKAFPDGWKP